MIPVAVRYVLFGICIGLLVEYFSYIFNLYHFIHQWTIWLVIFMIFGSLGLLSYAVRGQKKYVQFLAGAFVGISAELFNVHVATLWIFDIDAMNLSHAPSFRAVILGSLGGLIPILLSACIADEKCP
ncbi:hypothetical protein ACC810_02905 [Rhizobium ruizarguesonis]